MRSLSGIYDKYSYDPEDKLRQNGKFAIVYLGKKQSDGSHVVIKKLHPRLKNNKNEIKRFRNEFRPELSLFYSASSIEFISDADDYFLIREYCPGISLDKFIGSRGWRRSRRKGELYELALKIIAAVREIHQAGLIHADLKPSNFIYNLEQRSIKVIDLGLSLPKEEAIGISRNEKHPLPFSMIYSPPEIMLNFPALIDERCDVYSLGIIFYQLFSGEVPWQDSNPAVLMNLQLVHPVLVSRKIPECLQKVIDHATQKYSFSQPPSRFPEIVQSLNLQEAMEKRYPNVEALQQDLEKCREVLRKRYWRLW